MNVLIWYCGKCGAREPVQTESAASNERKCGTCAEGVARVEQSDDVDRTEAWSSKVIKDIWGIDVDAK